jgi:hypothetical protein
MGKTSDKNTAPKGKGKEKEKVKDKAGGGSAAQENAGKVKGAQSINVRHILVC